MSMHSRTHAPILTTLLIVFLGSMASAPTALAQNRESDLARENEQLRARISDLEATLEAAMNRIQELETRIKTMKSNGGSAGSSNTAAAAPPAPAASPGGVIAEIQSSHAEAVASGAIPPSPDARDEAASARHQRAVQKWVATANRNFRRKVKWPVVMSDVQRLNVTSARMVVTIWDVSEDQPTGKSFPITIPVRVLDRLQRLEARKTDATRTLELEGVFLPGIRFNPQRQEVGPFDNPRFIAPGIEMTWGFEFKSIGPLITDAKDG